MFWAAGHERGALLQKTPADICQFHKFGSQVTAMVVQLDE